MRSRCSLPLCARAGTGIGAHKVIRRPRRSFALLGGLGAQDFCDVGAALGEPVDLYEAICLTLLDAFEERARGSQKIRVQIGNVAIFVVKGPDSSLPDSSSQADTYNYNPQVIRLANGPG